MKALTYNLLNQTSLSNIVQKLRVLLNDKSNKLEVVIRNRQDSATHAQFKAIFGAWFRYMQDTHNRSIEYFHQYFKLKFLVKIYEADPIGQSQELWAENIILWMEKGETEKALETRNKISLSWATKEQMCRYMSDIEIYFIEIGQPLPPIESVEQRKTYEQFKRRLGLRI